MLNLYGILEGKLTLETKKKKKKDQWCPVVRDRKQAL